MKYLILGLSQLLTVAAMADHVKFTFSVGLNDLQCKRGHLIEDYRYRDVNRIDYQLKLINGCERTPVSSELSTSDNSQREQLVEMAAGDKTAGSCLSEIFDVIASENKKQQKPLHLTLLRNSKVNTHAKAIAIDKRSGIVTYDLGRSVIGDSLIFIAEMDGETSNRTVADEIIQTTEEFESNKYYVGSKIGCRKTMESVIADVRKKISLREYQQNRVQAEKNEFEQKKRTLREKLDH